MPYTDPSKRELARHKCHLNDHGDSPHPTLYRVIKEDDGAPQETLNSAHNIFREDHGRPWYPSSTKTPFLTEGDTVKLCFNCMWPACLVATFPFYIEKFRIMKNVDEWKCARVLLTLIEDVPFAQVASSDISREDIDEI